MGLEDIVRAAKDHVGDAAKVVADKVGDVVDGAEDQAEVVGPHVRADAFNAQSKAKVEGEVLADKTRGAAAVAADKMHDAAEVGEGWLDKAKAKVGEVVTDAHLDNVAEKIKGVTPDPVDRVVDRAAEAAKRLND